MLLTAATRVPVARPVVARRRHHARLRASAPGSPEGSPLAGVEPPVGVRFDAESSLLADIERLKAKKGREDAVKQASVAEEQSAAGAAEGVLGWKERLDGFLVYDFFFICFALVWLGVGVAVQTSTENKIIMDAWLGLWPFVFQPALGVLMLASLVSGGIGWAKENKFLK